MKIEGKILTRGEELHPGDYISKDCKITLPKNTDNLFLLKNYQQDKPIGEINHISDDGRSISVTTTLYDNKPKLSLYQRFINLICRVFKKKEKYDTESLVDKLKKLLNEDRAGFGVGGSVLNREGKEIVEFDVREISIIPK